MELLNNKTTGSELPAGEWNQVPSELQQLITNTGQALADGDLAQVSKAVYQYASAATFYTDSGAADAYVLTTSAKVDFVAGNFDGKLVRFIPGNTNTGASTVAVETDGAVGLVDVDGNPLIGGEILAGREVVGTFISGAYRLLTSALTAELEVINAITDSGQTPTQADLFELSRAFSNFSAFGSFYDLTGAANNLFELVLNGTQKAVFVDGISDTNFPDGGEVRFISDFTTTTNVTISVPGVAAVKPLVDFNGEQIPPGGIIAGQLVTCYYQLSATRFCLGRNPNVQENNVIEDSGQTLDQSDSEQLSKAMSNFAGFGNFFTPTGTPNSNYALLALDDRQLPTVLFDGLEVRFESDFTNTGASTLVLGGFASKDLVNHDGTPLVSNEIRSGAIVICTYDLSTDTFNLLNADSSAAAIANTIVRRDSSSNINVNTVVSSAAFTTSPALSAIWVETFADGVMRKQTEANFKTALGLQNLTNNTFTGALNVTGAITSSVDIDADTVDGFAQDASLSNSTIVRRDSSGNIRVDLVNSVASFTTSSTLSAIWVEISSDGFMRKQTEANFKTALDLQNLSDNTFTGALNVTGAITSNVDIDADEIDGFSQSVSATGNTIARRNSSGEILATTVNLSVADTGTTPTRVWVEVNSDNDVRGQLLATFKSNLGVANLSGNNFSGNFIVAGTISATGDITSTTSDARLKNITEELSPAESFSVIYTAKKIKYRHNALAKDLSEGALDSDTEHLGFIVQDFDSYPQLTPLAPIDSDDDGNSKTGENYKTLRYERTTVLLASALEHVYDENSDLRERVEMLEKRLTALEK